VVKGPISVLLVDEHAILREGLRALLSSSPDLLVVGEAGDGPSAIRACQSYSPAVVVMDLFLPRMNGIDAAREILQRQPGTGLLVLTSDISSHCVCEAIRAGVSGYLDKDCGVAEIIQAIRSIAKGDVYLSPASSAKLIKGFRGNSTSAEAGSAWNNLTKRERQVLQLIGEGCPNRETAKHLNISVKTVEKHRANLMQKLGIRSTHALIAYWNKRGLTKGALERKTTPSTRSPVQPLEAPLTDLLWGNGQPG